jgi:BMFP domain-containing protein YqiC
MALKPPPPPWEVLQQVGEAVGGSGVRSEVDKGLKALAQSALTRLDVVSREEFDAQVQILRRTRSKVTALEAELEELTRMLEALTHDQVVRHNETLKPDE